MVCMYELLVEDMNLSFLLPSVARRFVARAFAVPWRGRAR